MFGDSEQGTDPDFSAIMAEDRKLNRIRCNNENIIYFIINISPSI